MRRGCETQHERDVADVVAGVLGQLGGRDQAHEVDHALEVGREIGGEGAAQVFARDADDGGDRVGAHGKTGMTDDAAPGLLLQGRREAECGWWLVEGGGETDAEAVRHDELARHAVVDAVDQHVGEFELGAARQEPTVGGAQWHHREKCRRRVIARELRGPPRIVRGRAAEVDQDRVDEIGAEGLRQLSGRAREDDARAAARERGAHERPGSISGRRRVDRQAGQLVG